MIIISEFKKTYSYSLDDRFYVSTDCMEVGATLEKLDVVKYKNLMDRNDESIKDCKAIGFYIDYNNINTYDYTFKLASSIKEEYTDKIIFCFGDYTNVFRYYQLPDCFSFASLNCISIKEAISNLYNGFPIENLNNIITPCSIPTNIFPKVITEYTNTNFFKDVVKSNNNLHYSTSKGCQNKCSYCYRCLNSNEIHKNIKDCFYDIDILSKVDNLRNIKITDNIFNFDLKRCKDILRYLIDKIGKKKSIMFEMRSEFIDEETAYLLSLLNSHVGVGVQSLNTNVLRIVNRSLDYNRFLNGIELLSKYNIHCSVDLIYGLPTEGIESFKSNFNNLFKIMILNNIKNNIYTFPIIDVFNLHVLPGTKLFEKKDVYGYTMDSNFRVTSSNSLSSEEINRLNSFQFKNSKCSKYAIEDAYINSSIDFFEMIEGI